MITSVLINIGFLMFFKYYNFFADSLRDSFLSLGISLDLPTLKLILPVGISFYTFHGMSYVFDIYRNQGKPTKNLVNYSLFVSYFPLLVAGPIERASHLLPQLEVPRKWNWKQFKEGLFLVSWGFFKKVVIADSLAVFVDEVFKNYQHESGINLLVGAVFFSFQIYGDFSGYSDIARGVSKFFGIELLLNFNFPYFSRSIPEFWKRWHISLSSWFRDYLFIPLGGSKEGKLKALRNVIIIFLVSGFWHGANWTFIIWGGIHALMYIPSFLFGSHKKYKGTEFSTGKWYPSLREGLSILATFALVTVAWIFFRADDVSTAWNFIHRMVSAMFSNFSIDIRHLFNFTYIVIFILLDLILHAKKEVKYAWQIIFFLLAMLLILNGEKPNFLYFQF
ncbi:MAG: MBOAT family O-acyltransferase [Bacteroidia bacterium]